MIILTGNGAVIVNDLSEAQKKFQVMEWDGVINDVSAFKKEEDVIMIYSDGLAHRVTEGYFKSLVINAAKALRV